MSRIVPVPVITRSTRVILLDRLGAGCTLCANAQDSAHQDDEIIAIRVESEDSVSAEVLRGDEFREIYFRESYDRFTEYEGRYER
jgi:hypothetical protein